MGNCLDCRAYGPREDAHTSKSGVDTAALLASSNNNASKGKDDPVAAAPEQGTAERPRPMVFALMRNGHEVLRGAMEDVSDDLEKGNKDAACAAYLELQQWSALHQLMEDGHNDGKTPKGLFAILDAEFDGIAQKNGLRDDHDKLDVMEDAMTAACNNKNTSLEELKALWGEFKTAYGAHLKKEEGVMMPQVMQLVKRGENLTLIMQTEILPLVSTIICGRQQGRLY
jgi:hemerythrin-like domain-containing protein